MLREKSLLRLFLAALCISQAAALSPAAQHRRGGRRLFASSPKPADASAAPTKTCRVCRASYAPRSNGERACRSHPGALRGESARKGDWEGARGSSTGDDGALVWSWSCCGADRDSPGCLVGEHRSYDD